MNPLTIGLVLIIICFLLKVAELPMVLRAMIDFDNNSPGSGGGMATMAPVESHAQRHRFRGRLQNKGGLLQPPSPNISEPGSNASPRSNYGMGELNRRIVDLKMDNPSLSPPHGYSSPKLLELTPNFPNHGNLHYQPTTLHFNQQIQQQIRRDSNNSTTSSSYYSMKSSDISRRSSQQSHTSSISTLRPNVGGNFNYNLEPSSASFYDPISPGSSRRSSQLSNITQDGGNNYGPPPPPSSQLLSSHLARLQRHSTTSAYPYPQHYGHQVHPQYPFAHHGGMMNQNFSGTSTYGHQQHYPYQMMGYDQTNSSSDRRMSEPIANSARNVETDFARQLPPRPRSTTPTKSLEMLLEPTKTPVKEQDKTQQESPVKPHPNEKVILDVLKTNEKIENCDELVIPDDMVLYLNQVVDDDDVTTKPPKIKLDLDSIDSAMVSSSIDVDKLKEEDLLSLLCDVEAADNSADNNDNSNVDNKENNNNDTDNSDNNTSGRSNDNSDDQEINNNSNNNNNVSHNSKHNNDNESASDCSKNSCDNKTKTIYVRS